MPVTFRDKDPAFNVIKILKKPLEFPKTFPTGGVLKKAAGGPDSLIVDLPGVTYPEKAKAIAVKAFKENYKNYSKGEAILGIDPGGKEMSAVAIMPNVLQHFDPKVMEDFKVKVLEGVGGVVPKNAKGSDAYVEFKKAVEKAAAATGVSKKSSESMMESFLKANMSAEGFKETMDYLNEKVDLPEGVATQGAAIGEASLMVKNFNVAAQSFESDTAMMSIKTGQHPELIDKLSQEIADHVEEMATQGAIMPEDVVWDDNVKQEWDYSKHEPNSMSVHGVGTKDQFYKFELQGKSLQIPLSFIESLPSEGVVSLGHSWDAPALDTSKEPDMGELVRLMKDLKVFVQNASLEMNSSDFASLNLTLQGDNKIISEMAHLLVY